MLVGVEVMYVGVVGTETDSTDNLSRSSKTNPSLTWTSGVWTLHSSQNLLFSEFLNHEPGHLWTLPNQAWPTVTGPNRGSVRGSESDGGNFRYLGVNNLSLFRFMWSYGLSICWTELLAVSCSSHLDVTTLLNPTESRRISITLPQTWQWFPILSRGNQEWRIPGERSHHEVQLSILLYRARSKRLRKLLDLLVHLKSSHAAPSRSSPRINALLKTTNQ